MLTPFGKYLLDTEIARGGMAQVFLARLRGLGGFEKTLVVKQVLPDLARDPRFVSMFVEEAKTLVQMSHPHIVPVYELGVVDGTYFLAMEYVDGATLAEVLEGGGPLDPSIVAHVAVQVCDALGYAHDRFDLVHRDVTPRNVIIDAQGHVRLLDFGIAAPVEEEGSTEIFGSFGYMAPEQAAGLSVGPQADLFSLGAVLFEALSAQPAFLRGSREATRQALLHERPDFSELAPEPLANLLQPLVALAAEDRPESAKLVARQLRGWLAGERPEGVAPELGGRVEAARRKRKRTPSTRPPSTTQVHSKKAKVKTLATNASLTEMLSRAPETAQETATADAEDDSGSPGPRTEKIDREVESADAKRSAPESPTPPRGEEESDREAGDEDERDAEHAAAATMERADGSEPSASSREASAAQQGPRGVAVALLGLIAGIVVTVAVVTAFDSSDVARTEEPRETPQVEAPPPTPPPDPVEEVVAPEVLAGSTPEAQEPAEQDPPTTAPEAAPMGSLTVNATPWAQVRLGRRALGETPKRAVPVPAGAHSLVLECPPLGTSARVSIRVRPGEQTRVFADLNQSPPTVRVQ